MHWHRPTLTTWDRVSGSASGWGCNGGAAPLAKMALYHLNTVEMYYNAHLAVILIPSFFLPLLAVHLALLGLRSLLRFSGRVDSRDKV